jgi:enoyl-CoA hydratase/carnithine racemase
LDSKKIVGDELMSSVLTNIEKNIGVITLNRPNKNNTFNTELARELNQSLYDFEQDPEVRVIVIKANGRNFSTGIDLNEFHGKSYSEYLKWVELMEQMSITIFDMKKPVISEVKGYAVANGIGLVASSDIVIASENAKFGATAVNVGLFCIGPAVPLSRVVGKKKAYELVTTGRIIEANEAKEIGLINNVVAEDDLSTEVMKMATELANKSPLAVQIGKEAFNATLDLPYKKALQMSHSYFAHLCSTDDAKEGVDAFLNKREPKWSLK